MFAVRDTAAPAPVAFRFEDDDRALLERNADASVGSGAGCRRSPPASAARAARRRPDRSRREGRARAAAPMGCCSEISAWPLPMGTSCTPGSRRSSRAGLTRITAWFPNGAISARRTRRPRTVRWRSASATMARPKSSFTVPRRSITSSGSVSVTEREARPPYFIGRPGPCLTFIGDDASLPAPRSPADKNYRSNNWIRHIFFT